MADITITPEIAEKVMSASMRNLIKRISEGSTLGAPDRELMHQFSCSTELTEQHARMRLSVLLRRWSTGGRLTKGELAEIADLVPDTSTVVKRVTRETYQRRLQDYEPIYGQKPNDARTIKRWVSLGRQKSDLPPLDDPASMPAWWTRHMKHQVPKRILDAASAAGPRSTPPAPAAPSSAPRTAAAPPAAPASSTPPPLQQRRTQLRPEDMGFAAKLEQLEQDVHDARQERDAAREDKTDSSRFILAERSYDAVLTRYREFQRDAEKIMSREGRAWSEAEHILSERLHVVNQSLRSLCVRICTKAGVSRETFETLEPVYQSELDSVFSHLAESDFSQPVEPFALEAA